MAAHTSNPNIQESKAGGSRIPSQSGLPNKTLPVSNMKISENSEITTALSVKIQQCCWAKLLLFVCFKETSSGWSCSPCSQGPALAHSFDKQQGLIAKI